MEKQVTIMIADDNNFFRESLRLILSDLEMFILIGEAKNGEEAIALSDELSPDIIIMDINMSPVNGFEATRKILKRNPAIKIIGMSMHSEPSYWKNMMRLGARGYLTKSTPYLEIIAALKEIAAGGKYIGLDLRDNL
ncbi:MAG: two component transcriptional regulator, LuxR family [Chitinophagaceae bacterium]|nr:two component transcriptional regulator, LuxR family [Chitinophagaceae bacterium]